MKEKDLKEIANKIFQAVFNVDNVSFNRVFYSR